MSLQNYLRYCILENQVTYLIGCTFKIQQRQQDKCNRVSETGIRKAVLHKRYSFVESISVKNTILKEYDAI